MEYQDALHYLDSFINYEKGSANVYPEAYKLDRMRQLVKELGNPQNAFESVLIAGSKGKGSTASIVSHILRMENYRVGLYTSPHLLDVRERIQINGLWINEIRFAEEMSKIRRVLDDYSWRKNPPTYFEVMTALAFSFFKTMKVQIAVLEIGLGGLYDSTNVAPAKVCGVTPVSLEHTDKLGKTVSKIAVQKCGIIKGREFVVSSAQTPEVAAVIEEACLDREAQLARVGKEIRIEERTHDEDAQRFDLKTPWGNFHDLELRLRGRHQLDNAAQAVGLAKALEKKTRYAVSEEAIRRGLLDAHWPGRLEKASDRPSVVLDGAHNRDSIQKLLAALHRHFRYHDLIVVFGSMSDKDVSGMMEELVREADCFVFTKAGQPRSLEPKTILSAADFSAKEVFVEPDTASALKKARELAGSEDLILVTGSLYLVGEARQVLLSSGAIL